MGGGREKAVICTVSSRGGVGCAWNVYTANLAGATRGPSGLSTLCHPGRSPEEAGELGGKILRVVTAQVLECQGVFLTGSLTTRLPH